MAKKDKDKPTEADYQHEAEKSEAFESPDEMLFAPVEPPAPVKVLVPDPPVAKMASHVDEAPTAEAIVRRLATLSPPQLGGNAGRQLLNDAQAWVTLQEPQ